jgi:hypothetical protein
VAAPSHVNEVARGLMTAQRLLGSLHGAFVAIQEAALRTKDYRRRSAQTLFGAVSLRVPQLLYVTRAASRPSCSLMSIVARIRSPAGTLGA